jgi:hypothetical protein
MELVGLRHRLEMIGFGVVKPAQEVRYLRLEYSCVCGFLFLQRGFVVKRYDGYCWGCLVYFIRHFGATRCRLHVLVVLERLRTLFAFYGVVYST